MLYPNPKNGRFTVNVGGFTKAESLLVEVMNAVGQQVYYNYAAAVNGQGAIELSMPEVANGVYLLKLNDASKTHNLRFTISK